MQFVTKLIVFLIDIYSIAISRLLGNCCRFHPSCSQYCKAAILQYGLVKGGWKGLCRLVRCNPWCEGGIDLL